MIKDYLEIRNAEGMPKLVDTTISTALLLNSKNGIRNCAIALTQAASPEVRSVFRNELNSSLRMHEAIYTMMMEKGWFHPVNLEKQFQMDQESSQNAVEIVSMDLFPGYTGRLGTFATPEK